MTTALLLPGGVEVPVELIDTSAGGVRLHFDEDRPRALSVGTPVVVRFTEPGAAHSLSAPGQVSWQVRGDGRSRLGVHFTDRESFFAQLSPSLWRRFDRREHERKRFAEREVVVTLTSGRRAWSGFAADIGAGGIGVDLTEVDGESLESIELVQVTVELPGESEHLVAACARAHQTHHAGEVRRGMFLAEGFRSRRDDLSERISVLLEDLLRNAGARDGRPSET